MSKSEQQSVKPASQASEPDAVSWLMDSVVGEHPRLRESLDADALREKFQKPKQKQE